jgi:hypothetical protein
MLATAAVPTSGRRSAAAPIRVRRASPTVAPDLRTSSTYRVLLMRGLTPDEAANLTAFLSGLHVGDQRWDLKEINRLLFLRDMQRTGRFGKLDGKPPLH